MEQGSRQVQTQTQQQVQTLSPQQILVVKLLELPALEMEDRVRAELLENPALEEGNAHEEGTDHCEDIHEEEEIRTEDGSEAEYDARSDYLTEDDIPDYRLQTNNRSRDDRREEIPTAEGTSFYDTLRSQLDELPLTPRQHRIAEYLIGSLDDDGLLRKSLTTLGDELAIYAGMETSEHELEEVLRMVQEFDPPGVGARSLQECLLIQLRRKREQHEAPEALLHDEELILSRCYDEFTRKHWDKIARLLNLSEARLQQALREIKRLNPRPGAALGEAVGRSMQQIVPDFIVETDDEGTPVLTLQTAGIPPLRMNRDFARMAEAAAGQKGRQTREEKEAAWFLRQKMEAAQGFMDAVRQRQHTLTVTMQAIIDLQRPFFAEGDETLLRPMILKDVAARTGLDISTISRVSNSKYVQTDFGIYPLKFFFNDGFTTEEGEERSVREMKAALQACIEAEDPEQPLTDDALCAMLKEKGYPIARRTVAKYRQQMHIPVARMRR